MDSYEMKYCSFLSGNTKNGYAALDWNCKVLHISEDIEDINFQDSVMQSIISSKYSNSA